MEKKNCFELLNEFKEYAKENKKLGLLKSSFNGLNEKLGGGYKYGLIVIGAIPSLGKTSLLIRESINWAKNGYRVLFFSWEMLREELIAKMLSYASYEIFKNEKPDMINNISYLDFLYNDINEKIYEKLNDKIEYLKNIIIFEKEDEISNIKTMEELIKNDKKDKVIVIIDYLQIIVSDTVDKENLKTTIDKYVSELRYFANKEKIPIFAISSLSRNSMYCETGMDSFKETGGIEYGTDYLLALEPNIPNSENYKEALKKYLTKEERKLKLTILKSRTSISGTNISLMFIPKYNEFIE